MRKDRMKSNPQRVVRVSIIKDNVKKQSNKLVNCVEKEPTAAPVRTKMIPIS